MAAGMDWQKLLIVDDDFIAREVLNGTLSGSYKTLLATQGEEALALARQELPDLILLDVMMPKMDGYEVCARLKADSETRDIPVIFVTALDRLRDEAKGFACGAVDYIAKPIRPELVKTRVRTHLELSRHRRHLEELVVERSAALHSSQEDIKLKEQELKQLFETMGEILSSRDHYTSEHALRVAAISVRLGRYLGLGEPEQKVLELGCLVHDIGKVAIPDDVLLKPGRFDQQDRRIMEFHPLVGAQLFSKRLADARITAIILQHHERLDGSGYPHGLRGEEIGELVRIVAVADVYEALIARRPYKRPMLREKALAILRDEVRQGKMEGRVVEALEVISADWDPLAITVDYAAAYVEDIELFRQKAYFREPLSDYYNYRYLLFLDEVKLLPKLGDQYHLIKTDFVKLKEFNQKVGYAKVDQLLDSIGVTLHRAVQRVNAELGAAENLIMLFRRGSDYLIYAGCADCRLTMLLEELSGHLQAIKEEWGLQTGVINQRFGADHPLSEALGVIFV